MAFPAVTWANLLDPGTRQEAEQFASLVQGYLSTQHKDDGSHGDITADSLTTTGDITAGGDLIGEADLSIAGDAAIVGDATVDDLTAAGTVQGLNLSVNTASAAGNLTIGAPVTATDPGSSSIQVPYATSPTRSTLFAFNAGQAVNIGAWSTGIGEMRWFIVYNLSASYAVTLKHVYSGGNGDMVNSTGADIVLTQYQAAMFVAYPGNSGKWAVFPLQSAAPPATPAFVTPTFSAGNFTANGSMTWTVASAETFQYLVVGDGMFLNFVISGTVGGTPDTLLKIAIPGGYTCQKRTIVPIITNNGGLQTSFAQISASGTTVDCSLNIAEANWAAGSATVYGQIFFEV